MTYSRWPDPLTHGAQDLGGGVAYSWSRCAIVDRALEDPPPTSIHIHRHQVECLWIWHDCQATLGPGTVAPGEPWGWTPTGIGLHTLVQEHPLTVTASVYWPDCCGLHGFITDGAWRPV